MRRLAQRVLQQFGYSIVPDALLYDWQKPQSHGVESQRVKLPDGADTYLRPDNPRLRELQQAYEGVDHRVTTPAKWTANYVRPEEMLYFRAHSPYFWQRPGRNNELTYALAYYYVKSNDDLRLLDLVEEDLAFGARAFQVEGRLVSRDLLDSVGELSFLERNLRVSQRRQIAMLDIGAGYGRLAYRAVTALPSIACYLCTDAVPVSTFLCEYYLRFRGADQRAHVIPLHEIKSAMRERPVDLAVNIHSFSECRLDAIAWWASLLREHSVPQLMVVPNRVSSDGVTMLTDAGEDFSSILAERGYRLVAREPKYSDPLVRKYCDMSPSPTTRFLFAL